MFSQTRWQVAMQVKHLTLKKYFIYIKTIRWNTSSLSYLYPLIKYCKLKVQKMIQLQNSVNQVSYAFIDMKWVIMPFASFNWTSMFDFGSIWCYAWAVMLIFIIRASIEPNSTKIKYWDSNWTIKKIRACIAPEIITLGSKFDIKPKIKYAFSFHFPFIEKISFIRHF